jgi:hypothetical protein
MNTFPLVEEIARGVNGGQYASASKVDDDYIFQCLPQWRVQSIQLQYNGGKIPNSNTIIKALGMKHGDWEQTIEHIIVPSEQDLSVDYLITTAPSVIALNSIINGIGYIGTKSTVNEFRQARNRSEIGVNKSIGLGKKKVTVLIENNNRLFFNTEILKDCIERSIFENPFIKGFNYNKDKFPINEAGIPLMKEFAIVQLRAEFRSLKDNLADGAPIEQKAVVQNVI